jgi:2-polyprenyl-3-methyl-5-hydroxy-6-metoxy-1,4-benzoquinol methylase
MTEAGKKWAETVRAEHAQADRVRTDSPGGDHWRTLAHRFAPTSREEAYKDDTLQALLRIVKPEDTVLDVGAGAGRLAVPLAERCHHVTAVEPSASMVERLTEQAKAWGVRNLSVVPQKWEDAEVQAADIVICAHVLYTVLDIEGFLVKLAAHANREVGLIVFEEPAMANYFPLWETVYGEKRMSLPCFSELKGVLTAMGAKFTAEKLPTWESRPFKDREAAVQESMTRLMVSPESAKAARVASAVNSSLVEAPGGLRFRWARPHQPWLVRWQTAGQSR